jgi:FkbM family methyltransferase
MTFIAGRELRSMVRAPFRKRHYIAASRMLSTYVHPVDSVARYLFIGFGEYPHLSLVNSPAGVLELNTYSWHDMLTINEIFCRLDYRSDSTDKIFVDFGSNIGISAAYFLSRSKDSYAYLFEPLRFNIERLRKNLQPFEGRYTLSEVAVGPSEGTVEFGWEETGRYGGVGMETGNSVSVRCVDSNKVLEGILAKHGRIDVLKIDIETLEEAVTTRIPLEIAKKIKKVYVEYAFASNPLSRTHRMSQYSWVSQFANLDLTGRGPRA